MNYKKIYKQLCKHPTDFGGYTEVHHIIPKSLGGTDDPKNLVTLSAREHLLAHKLLVKITNADSMVYALHGMTNNWKGKKLSSRHYAKVREDFSRVHAKRTGDQHPCFGGYPTDGVMIYSDDKHAAKLNNVIPRRIRDYVLGLRKSKLNWSRVK